MTRIKSVYLYECTFGTVKLFDVFEYHILISHIGVLSFQILHIRPSLPLCIIVIPLLNMYFMFPESNGKLHFHDATVDPCGWDNDQPNVNVAQPLHNIMNSSYVKGSGGTQKVVMVIDRLEKIALYQDPLQLIRSLHILASGETWNFNFISILGEDIFSTTHDI